MPLNRCFQCIKLCSFGILLSLGCGSNKLQPISNPSTPTTTPILPSLPGVPTNGTQIYAVVPGYAVDTGWSPDGIFIFAASDSGIINDDVDHLEVTGSHVAVDEKGNVYALTTQGIEVFAPNAPNFYIRSVPVDPSTVKDMAVSPAGDVYVSDGKGVAVYPSSASPSRYILGQSQTADGATTAIVPGHIAVDSSDNLYAQNTVDSSIAVFGSSATGTISPSRIIGGPLARLASSADNVRALTTDDAGNLYVLCNCTQAGSTATDFGVLEFGPAATGNMAPLQFVTAPQMTSFGADGSIAVDSAGTLYVNTRWTGGGELIFEFTAGTSGSFALSQMSTISVPRRTTLRSELPFIERPA
jgi:hypothetical protein